MSSADSDLRRLGPYCPPRGGRGGSPGGTRRATCPRPLRPGAVADSAASFGGPVAEPASSVVSAPPFKESYPWPVPWDPDPCPIFPSFSLRHRERVGTVGAASVPSRGKFISRAGRSWALIYPQYPGWARGGGDASAEGEYPSSWRMGT